MVLQGQDGWRKHPMLNNLWRKNPLPGFKWAALVYGTYMGVEFIYKSATAPKKVAMKH